MHLMINITQRGEEKTKNEGRNEQSGDGNSR